MREAYIFAGNYGSGKTELSLNTALDLAAKGRTVLCDMDIVNPYFRSSEHKKRLEDAGVRLVSPPFANTGVDVPALSAEVMAAFEYDYAIFDAGGDPVGAAALGGFRPKFEQIRPQLRFYYVVNARRPFQADAQEAAEMLSQIQSAARLRIDGLVNNSNLARETTVADLEEGNRICHEITDLTGIPLALTTGEEDILRQYVGQGFEGRVQPIRIYTRPEWLDPTAES